MSKTSIEIKKLENKINFLKKYGFKLEKENIKYSLVSSSHISFYPNSIKEIDTIANLFVATTDKSLFTKPTSIKETDLDVKSPFSFNVDNGKTYKKPQLRIKYIDTENRLISINIDFDIFYNYFENFGLVTSKNVMKKAISNGNQIEKIDFVQEYMNIGKTISYVGNSFTTVAITEEQADIYNTLMGRI